MNEENMTRIEKKVLEACHRIEELYNETDGKCYLSFSGGKDSTVILALIKLCEEVYTIPENGIPAVFSNTGIELQATVDFVKWVKENYYSNVQMIRPEKSFSWVINNKGKPMKSKMKSEYLGRFKKGNHNENVMNYLIYGKSPNGKKYAKTKLADKDMHMVHDDFEIIASNKCCEYMKKKPFKKYEKDNCIKGALTGVRIGEGGARELATIKRIKNGGKLCTFTKNNVIYKMPIIDWTDEDVQTFIKQYNVPLSKAYTLYSMERSGCMGCPYSMDIEHNLQVLYDFEPNKYKATMYWLKDVYIAQDVRLPFDENYEREREREWASRYEPMRQEMLRKYRQNSRLIKEADNVNIFDLIEMEKEVNDRP